MALLQDQMETLAEVVWGRERDDVPSEREFYPIHIPYRSGFKIASILLWKSLPVLLVSEHALDLPLREQIRKQLSSGRLYTIWREGRRISGRTFRGLVCQ